MYNKKLKNTTKIFSVIIALITMLSSSYITCYAQEESVITSSTNKAAIDRTGPTFESVTTSSGNEWTWMPVTITVNGAKDDGVGLADEAYSFSTEQYDYNWQSSNETTVYRSWSVWVYIRDKAGNITCAGYIPIFIDNTRPEIEYVEVIDNDNGSYTLTIVASDWGSGISSYSFDGGRTWQKEDTATIFTNEASIEVAVSDYMTYRTYYTVYLEGVG